MTRQIRLALSVLALACLCIFVIGCGSDRVTSAAPGLMADSLSMGDQPALQQGVALGAKSKASSSGTTSVSSLATPRGTATCVSSVSAEASVTQLISAAAGGEIRNGRYRVVFPAGALGADTNITVHDLGNGCVMCELLPHGITFKVPVLLEMDLTGLASPTAIDLGIFWYNTTTGLWEDQGATYAGSVLQVSLGHFSTYAGGRAGW
jgi:hypothetical protein